jgi:hypothetical protein
LIDLLALEKEFRAQIGRLVADNENPELVRQQRDAAREQIEDCEAAVAQLAGDVAAASQAVHQARCAEARDVAAQEAPNLVFAAKQLEQALRDVATSRTAMIAAGSKLRAAALQVGDSNPGRFGVEKLLEDIVRDRLVQAGGVYGAAVPTLVAPIVQDAEAL